ncbi:hypothetical protein EDD85DRAFT_830031 [Armillaria nabsnona]|nr:hypothetical protein EDD85DRAFT_830031 [Armillaria nabsnona]
MRSILLPLYSRHLLRAVPTCRRHFGTHSVLPRCQYHVFRRIAFYPATNRCTLFKVKDPFIEERAVFQWRLPGSQMYAWTEALPRVLPLLVVLRRVKVSGQMYLHARHRVRTGVQGLLA